MIKKSVVGIKSENKSPSPHRLAALELARKKKTTLKNNNLERQREKWDLALRWTHAWGVTTASILCKVVGCKDSSFIKTMRDQKLIRHTKILNQWFYCLTQKGLNELKTILPEWHSLHKVPWMRDPSTWAFTHHQAAQELLAEKLHLHGENVSYWRSDRQLKNILHRELRVPDASLTLHNHSTIYFEVETTKKYNDELSRMLIGLIQLAMDENVTCEIYTSKELALHYANAVDSLAWRGKYHHWQKDANGRWYTSGESDFNDEQKNALNKRVGVFSLA